MKTFFFENAYSDCESKYAAFHPNRLTIVVGRNGYGKTSFMHALENKLKTKNIPYIEWNDNSNGRSNGMSKLMWNDDLETLAQMAFHSEGEALLTSFGKFCVQRIKYQITKYPDTKELFVLIDQIDSGLDVYMINDIKNAFKGNIIPDLKARGVTVYIVMTSNGYELARDEDCIDPVTRNHIIFNDYNHYVEYISSMYRKSEDGE